VLAKNFNEFKLKLCRPHEENILERVEHYAVDAERQRRLVDEGVPQRGEIALAASLGFWVTIGLLATYARYGGLRAR
jgi:hypothetical protein